MIIFGQRLLLINALKKDNLPYTLTNIERKEKIARKNASIIGL